MLKKQYLALAVSAALAASAAQALDAGSFTITGNIKNETGMLQNSGSFNGETTSTSDTTQHHKSQTGMKAENSLRLFVNGDIGDSSMHAELLLQNDHLDKTDLREFSQSEYLRELYIDTEATGWDFRVGKQQVVWGTADGAKLLDLINPTDYREMAQNKPDESRIPVWMLKADKYNDDGSSFQAIISQPRENVFAGLNREISATRRNNGAIANSSYTSTLWSSGAHFSQWSDDTSGVGHDKGSPFILKGVDSITGQYNGFLNIVPDIGSVAALFGRAFEQAGTNTNTGLNPNKLWESMRVSLLVDSTLQQNLEYLVTSLQQTSQPHLVASSDLKLLTLAKRFIGETMMATLLMTLNISLPAQQTLQYRVAQALIGLA